MAIRKVYVNTIINKFKSDPVLIISGILAAVSCFFVFPDEGYIDYIDFRVLAILGSLMLVVGSLSETGAFDVLTSGMLSKVKGQRSCALILTMLSFVLSMFMTNDVTLVTLVPFALMTVGAFGDKKGLMYTLILMTCAANLGSMLTPVGNPQNLYLYTKYEMDAGHFLLLTLPYTALSFAMVIAGCFIFVKNGTGSASVKTDKKPSGILTCIYVLLFVVCLLSVLGFLHYLIMLGIVVVMVVITCRSAFKKVDYSLLLTFIFFFILIGNLGRIDIVYNAVSSIVAGNTVLTAVVTSQFISNVPCAMLLSAFTGNGDALVIGTNLGGLGTLIASMASLITYKIYIRNNKGSGKYIAAFTVINVIMLIILYAEYMIIGAC